MKKITIVGPGFPYMYRFIPWDIRVSCHLYKNKHVLLRPGFFTTESLLCKIRYG